jgi:hypothetical protein
MHDWIVGQIAGFEALVGSSVLQWSGEEMAFREEGATGLPDWHDPDIHFLQMCQIDGLLDDGSVLTISTYQSDDQWGLCRPDHMPVRTTAVIQREIENASTRDPKSIYRYRPLTELPTGHIRHVAVSTGASDDLSALSITIGAQTILLWPGEVYENWDGSLTTKDMDESVLVQVVAASA